MVYYLKSFCKGSFGGCQGQPSARPWHLLIAPLGLQPFPPHRFVSLRGYFHTHYYIVLFHRLSCDSCSACLLPTVHLGKYASHSNRSYTLPGGSRQQAEGFALEQFHDPPFLPRTI